MALGVPYPEHTEIVREGDRLVEWVRCPVCHETFRETEKKDFESFSHGNYVRHVENEHPEKVV